MNWALAKFSEFSVQVVSESLLLQQFLSFFLCAATTMHMFYRPLCRVCIAQFDFFLLYFMSVFVTACVFLYYRFNLQYSSVFYDNWSTVFFSILQFSMAFYVLLQSSLTICSLNVRFCPTFLDS